MHFSYKIDSLHDVSTLYCYKIESVTENLIYLIKKKKEKRNLPHES